MGGRFTAGWAVVLEILHQGIHEALHRAEGDVPAVQDAPDRIPFKLQDFHVQERVLPSPDLNSPPTIQVSVWEDAPVQLGLKARECICECVVDVPHFAYVLFLLPGHNPFS